MVLHFVYHHVKNTHVIFWMIRRYFQNNKRCRVNRPWFFPFQTCKLMKLTDNTKNYWKPYEKSTNQLFSLIYMSETGKSRPIDCTSFIILKVSPNHPKNDVGVPHMMINKMKYQIFDSRFCHDMPARYVITMAFFYSVISRNWTSIWPLCVEFLDSVSWPRQRFLFFAAMDIRTEISLRQQALWNSWSNAFDPKEKVEV